MKNSRLPALLLALWPLLLSGQSVAPLLDVSGHPRAAAMGDAFTAVSGESASAWWNPAGIESVLDTDIFVMHQSWFSDSDIEFVSAARRFTAGAAGVTVAYLHMLPFEIVNAAGQTAGTSSVYDLAFLASFARRFGAFPAGASVKILYRDLDGVTGSLFGVDLGASRDFSFMKFYKSQLPNAGLSLAVKNIGTPILFGGGNVPVPVAATLGFRCVPCRANVHSVLFTVDGTVEAERYRRRPAIAAGLEYGFMESFFLRFGVNIRETVRPSAGAGFSFNLGGLNLHFDVAILRKNAENVFSTALSVRNSADRGQRVRLSRSAPGREQVAADIHPLVNARPVVGFLSFVNLTQKPRNDYLCDTIPESVQTIISKNTNVRLIDRWKLSRILPSADRMATNYSILFDKAGISQVVTGSFVESDRDICVNLKVIDTRTSAVLFGASVNGTQGKGLFGLIDRISDELNRLYLDH